MSCRHELKHQKVFRINDEPEVIWCCECGAIFVLHPFPTMEDAPCTPRVEGEWYPPNAELRGMPEANVEIIEAARRAGAEDAKAQLSAEFDARLGTAREMAKLEERSRWERAVRGNPPFVPPRLVCGAAQPQHPRFETSVEPGFTPLADAETAVPEIAETAADAEKVCAELERVEKLFEAGHTPHCARRIVWGDGECECGKDGELTLSAKPEEGSAAYSRIKVRVRDLRKDDVFTVPEEFTSRKSRTVRVESVGPGEMLSWVCGVDIVRGSKSNWWMTSDYELTVIRADDSANGEPATDSTPDVESGNAETATLPSSGAEFDQDMVGKRITIGGATMIERAWFKPLNRALRFRDRIVDRVFLDPVFSALNMADDFRIDFLTGPLDRVADSAIERATVMSDRIADRLKPGVPQFLRPFCYRENEHCGTFEINKVVSSTELRFEVSAKR
jgi:hypothetical protein